jgi:glycerol-3-phosphate dehydrogenase
MQQHHRIDDQEVDVAEADSVDLLVVGGGVNGAGVARDAAGRGLKVALIEQADLAAATSSASTKLIHGGLRYLEFFEFRLVREALIEREQLLAIAPHIIRPMRFILPHVAGLRPRWQIRAGLFLYDHLGGRKRLPASRSVRLTGDAFGPLQPSLRHGFAYADCWVDDSRLVVLNARDAADRGAAIHTRTRFVSASVREDCWVAHCERNGARFDIRARAIVNAAGPWVEQVLRALPRVQVDAQVRLIKGSHIVVPRLYDGEHAFMLQNPDGRIVFTIPYEQRYTLIGTTDVPFDGDPARVRISTEEIEYLCATVSSYFRSTLAPQAVHWTYAGVRPLSDDESANASKVTRDYRLELDESGDHPVLMSVFGGKITTYRRLAEMALSKLHPYVGGAAASWTDRSPLPGGDLPRGDFDAFLTGVRARWSFLAPEQALRLARAYGTRIDRILGDARRIEDLGEDYGAGLTRAEVDYLIAHEWARDAEDILWRRTKLGLHMSEAQRQRLHQSLV